MCREGAQGLSLWCFNIVGGEVLTFPDTPTTPLVVRMVFQHRVSGGRDFPNDFDLRASHTGSAPTQVLEGLSLWCFNIVAFQPDRTHTTLQTCSTIQTLSGSLHSATTLHSVVSALARLVDNGP